MDQRVEIDADEALAVVLAGDAGAPHADGLAWDLPDGSLVVVSDEPAPTAPRGLEDILTALLHAHDPARLTDCPFDEYRGEAGDLAERLRATPPDGPLAATQMLADVLRHWFLGDDGLPAVEFADEDLAPVGAAVFAAYSAA